MSLSCYATSNLFAMLSAPDHKLRLISPPSSYTAPVLGIPKTSLRPPATTLPLSTTPLHLHHSSPNSLTVAYTTGHLVIWDVERGVSRPVNLGGRPSGVYTTEKRIYTHVEGETLIDCRDRSTLAIVQQIKCGKATSNHALKFTISPTQSLIAIAAKRDTCKILCLKTGAKRKTVTSPGITYLDFLKDNLLLVGTATHYEVHTITGEEEEEVPPVVIPTSSDVTSSNISPMGGQIVTTTVDGSVHLTSIVDGVTVSSAPCGAIGVRFLNDDTAVVVRPAGSSVSFAKVATVPMPERLVVENVGGEQSGRKEKKEKRGANELQLSVKGAGEKGSTGPARDKRQRVGSNASDAEGEVTVGEKLARLGEALDDESSEEEEEEAGEEGGKNESLGALLAQALTSDDDAQLEVCLGCKDKEVVYSTIKGLSPGNVMQLLTRVVDRISRRPARAPQMGVWLHGLMKAHAGVFMSNEILARKLAPVQSLLKERMETHIDLVRLDGRLGVLEFLG